MVGRDAPDRRRARGARVSSRARAAEPSKPAPDRGGSDTPRPVLGSPDTQNLILVGRFGAPHGVRGEIRLQSFTRDPAAIATYGPLLAGPRAFTLASLRALKDNLFVARVVGVETREAAQALTHVALHIPRAALPQPDADEFYLADLIGLAAVDAGGVVLGTVIAVPNYGAGDILEIAPTAGGETLLFPFTKAVVPTLDFAARRLTIVPPIESVDPDDDGDR